MFGNGAMKVIIYDEKEMKSYGGYVAEWEMSAPTKLDATTLDDDYTKIITIPPTTAKAVVELRQQIIELDPTTMKRISRFNLEKENEDLLKEIEQHKKDIEGLKEKYKDLSERLKTISEIGKDIWENGTEYERESEYDDYDYE